MRIFVASSFCNKPAARVAMRELECAGHTITFDWTQPEKLITRQDREDKAMADYNGVVSADALVVVWPGRLGTATEIGIALAVGLPVYIYGNPDHNSIYWYHPQVKIIKSLKEIPHA